MPNSFPADLRCLNNLLKFFLPFFKAVASASETFICFRAAGVLKTKIFGYQKFTNNYLPKSGILDEVVSFVVRFVKLFLPLFILTFLISINKIYFHSNKA